MSINCIIVEDAPLAVEKLEGFIRQVPHLNLLQSFSNGIDAVSYIKTHQVDLVFLDIQMEEFTGLQFLESLQHPPGIIIVTAYDQYAVSAFDHAVIDYLLKPYSFERFLKAVDKVSQGPGPVLPRDYIFVKTEYRVEKVNFSDILYIEGKGAYLRIVTPTSRIMTLKSFIQMERLLPSADFLRIHKSFIIAINKIDSIERFHVLIGQERLPVGQSYRERFLKVLNLKDEANP